VSRLRALVTGGSGFFGRQIVAALRESGHEVTDLSLAPHPEIPTILADLTASDVDFGGRRFDVVYHAAGLAHRVPKSEEEANLFFRVNRDGTRHLMAALARNGLPESFLLISTVAVYGLEVGTEVDENQPRRASDPYGLSKKQAEDDLAAWGQQHGVRTAVVRLPLLAGPHPPGNLGAMIAALRRGRYLNVGGGHARRSMVLAREVAAMLPRVARRGGTYHLTDGHHPSFAELATALANELGVRQPISLPMVGARLAAGAGDLLEGVLGREAPFNSRKLRKMTSSLTFSDERARRDLDWSPSRVIDHVRELI